MHATLIGIALISVVSKVKGIIHLFYDIVLESKSDL